MPYIKKKDRTMYDDILNKIDLITTKEDLEYCIFKLMKKFMSDKEQRNSNLHDCVYAAIHCGDEYRRRFLDTREDLAMEINGDIE